jgi:hypothetical protein
MPTTLSVEGNGEGPGVRLIGGLGASRSRAHHSTRDPGADCDTARAVLARLRCVRSRSSSRTASGFSLIRAARRSHAAFGVQRFTVLAALFEPVIAQVYSRPLDT